MNQQQALSLLIEIRGLERLRAAITRQITTATEWRFGLVAIDDRLAWCRYCWSLEHPTLRDSVEDLVDVEPPKPVEPVLVMHANIGGRIH